VKENREDESMTVLLSPMARTQAVINYAHRLGRKIQSGTRSSDEALCKAQMKAVLEYLEKEYPPIITWKCWGNLKKEIEGVLK